jgi:hypothetical protein
MAGLRELSNQSRTITLEDLLRSMDFMRGFIPTSRRSVTELKPEQAPGYEPRLRINIRKSAIFRPREKPGRRRAALLLLFLVNGLSLLASLRILSAKAETRLRELQKLRMELVRYQPESEDILRRIAELKNQHEQKTVRREFDPYALMAEINLNLTGAWIRSLTIDEDQFTLEAEGTDSIGVLQGLEQSGCFYGVTLHQAFPSTFRGERFSISGRIYHGE